MRSAGMNHGVYNTEHYASGLGTKLRRAVEVGPKYYLHDVPRYWLRRRRLGLPAIDTGALWSPVRSFAGTTYASNPLPPRYVEALDRMLAAGVHITNPPARTEALTALWWAARDAGGDVIECGAYRGATSLLLAILGHLNGITQQVHVLDTFAGMPPPSSFDDGRVTGEFALPADWVEHLRGQARALGVGDRIEVHAGLFSETFPAIGAQDARFAFAHIDANIYSGTLEACEFVLPRMAAGGAVVFDDYNGFQDLGARLAIDQFFAKSSRRPAPLADCSAYVRT